MQLQPNRHLSCIFKTKKCINFFQTQLFNCQINCPNENLTSTLFYLSIVKNEIKNLTDKYMLQGLAVFKY